MECKATSCTKQGKITKGYCTKHYARLLRHEDVDYINPKCNRDGLSKLRHRVYQKQWRKDNWEYYRAYLNASKKRLKQATPPWVDKAALIDIYQNRPKGFHVDHVVPIAGKTVCGLHVPWNLQYLTALENLKKHNHI